MLIHDRFVFLHMPKAGGAFVRIALERELNDLWSPPDAPVNLHHGWDSIPPWARDRPVLAFIRNPWDWYVSWYHYIAARATPAMPQRAREPLSQWLFSSGSGDTTITPNDFATTLERSCRLDGDDRSSERRALARVLTEVPIEGDDALAAAALPWLPARALGERLVEGRDVYSAGFLTGFDQGLDSELLTIGRSESLADDLLRFLDTAGVGLSQDAIARIGADPPRNRGDHAPFRQYYDEELRDLVGSSCEELIERFGYSFEASAP